MLSAAVSRSLGEDRSLILVSSGRRDVCFGSRVVTHPDPFCLFS